MRPSVKVKEIQHRQRVTVLIVIEHKSDLVKEHLRVRLGHLFRVLFLHGDSRFSADRSQDVLMRYVYLFARDLYRTSGQSRAELEEAGDRFRLTSDWKLFIISPLRSPC